LSLRSVSTAWQEQYLGRTFLNQLFVKISCLATGLPCISRACNRIGSCDKVAGGIAHKYLQSILKCGMTFHDQGVQSYLTPLTRTTGAKEFYGGWLIPLGSVVRQFRVRQLIERDGTLAN
jgi:hypothetical protein